MSKLKSTAIWNRFNDEQKEQIEEWLYGKNLSYKTVAKKAEQEFGVKGSLMAFQRIYQHLARLRAIIEVADIEEASADLAASGCQAEHLHPSLMKMLSARLLQQTMEKADPRDVAVYGRILMQGQARDIQRDRAALAREKHQFKAAEAALKALPLVDKFTQEDDAREDARVADMRYTLFGDAPLTPQKTPDLTPINTK